MARIKPFKAVRPVADKVHLVASRSYVSYSKDKLKEKLDSNQFTFIHIINPDYNSADQAVGGSSEMFEKVRSRYDEFKENGTFLKEEKESFYVYSQLTPTHSYTGIIAGVSAEDYRSKKIKIHESTISRREELFTNYLDATDFNAEPVLLSYSKNESISKLISEAKKNNPLYDFSTSDAVRHTLWKIDDEEKIMALQNSMSQVDALYVADGHHRSASSVNLAEKRNNPNKNANSNWFMAMISQEDDMEIFGFHRLLTGFEKPDTDKIISKINSSFDLKQIDGDPFSPIPGEVHMYYFGTGWTKFKLALPETTGAKDQIDAQKFSQQILSPIAGITDLKKDKRVKFIPAKDDLSALIETIDNGNDILFLLAPVTFEQLRAVADASENMPPKSTYIEPKLRSGLTIFEISDE